MSKQASGRSTGRPARRRVLAALEPVRRRIEEWREARRKRTRMPEDLWGAAVGAAREHGVWAVSQVLRVNYESLKARLHRSGSECAAASEPRFVELEAAGLLPSVRHEQTVLEMSSASGAKLVVRLGAHERCDVTALARSLWDGGR